MREAKERDLEILPPPPKQKISDPAELADYQHRKRKAFEDNIRKNRMVVGNWVKYAQWEESQKEIQRARSIYERALDNDHRNVTIWLKYIEMEMKNRQVICYSIVLDTVSARICEFFLIPLFSFNNQVNHARNLFDRAVTILPRVNQFWYKYVYMEELLENLGGARAVFERWLEFLPEEQAWNTYINFELRYKEIERARGVYQRLVLVHPDVKNWIKFARFEENHGFINGSRQIYEKAVEFFGEDHMEEKLFISFAKFEESQKEHDRVRVIYKYALDHLPKDKTENLYKAYTIHEKKFGDRSGIEDVIVSKRKFQYEQEIVENPTNYDAWFDYLRLIESEGVAETIRETYERAIANVPPSKDKSFWRRYIYLWINYALYEEIDAQNEERTRQVYKTCLEIIPHKIFTFSKIWLMYAQFEIRSMNLMTARKALGQAIGTCPRDKLFRGYIELEIQLREFDRCRILYQKFLEFGPENCITWMRFAELEALLGDIDRARAIFELAINQPRLDMPELLWKAYIDFEVKQGENELARQLYERLLERTVHVKVWISYAKFELACAENAEGELNVKVARRIYERANESLKSLPEKENRVILLEAWRDFESEYSKTGEEYQKVVEKLPRRVKKRQKIISDSGIEEGWEEVFDYIFPEDEMARPNLKLLAAAKNWKKKREESSIVPDEPTSSSPPPSTSTESMDVESNTDNNSQGNSDANESPDENSNACPDEHQGTSESTEFKKPAE